MKSLLLALTLVSSVAMAKQSPVCKEVILDSQAEDRFLNLYMEVNTIQTSEAQRSDGTSDVLGVIDRCNKLADKSNQMGLILKSGKNFNNNKALSTIVKNISDRKVALDNFTAEGRDESKKLDLEVYLQKGLDICKGADADAQDLLNQSDKDVRDSENTTCKK